MPSPAFTIGMRRLRASTFGAPEEGCRYLFLDEPVSSLDIYYQHQLLELARELVREKVVLIAVLHDLNLALQYADRILFLREGILVAEGPVPAVVQPLGSMPERVQTGVTGFVAGDEQGFAQRIESKEEVLFDVGSASLRARRTRRTTELPI